MMALQTLRVTAQFHTRNASTKSGDAAEIDRTRKMNESNLPPGHNAVIAAYGVEN
jgi:hypothetical protein